MGLAILACFCVGPGSRVAAEEGLEWPFKGAEVPMSTISWVLVVEGSDILIMNAGVVTFGWMDYRWMD